MEMNKADKSELEKIKNVEIHNEGTEVQFTDADGDVILLRLTSGKVTEYVNGELESEDVQWFGIDLSERKYHEKSGHRRFKDDADVLELQGRIEALFAGAAKTRSASKADWVRRVQLDGSELCHAPDNLKDDKDVVMAALGRRCRWNTLKFASSRLREDEDVVLKAVGSDGRNLVFAAEKFRDDKDFVLKMLRGKHWNLEEVSERLRGDKDVVIASKRLQFASSELRGNKDVVIATVRGCDLQFASEELRDDKDVVMAAVEFRLGEELNPPSGKALQYASSRLQADKDVVLKAASSTGDALQFASEDLRNDREVVWCAFREGMYCLHILEWASDEIRQDEQFMLRARNAAKDGGLKMKWKFALKFCGGAPPSFVEGAKVDDFDELLAAVEADGLCLQLASERLRSDRDIVMSAVKQKGFALKFAAESLKSDRQIVMAALMESGSALQFAAPDVLEDKAFLLEAVRATRASWLVHFCSESLRKDLNVTKEVEKAAGSGLIWTYYKSYSCFLAMREAFMATGSSVPGGQAYQQVMEQLKKTSGGAATVWFDEIPVFGFSADGGNWVHPSSECGRDYVEVPDPAGRHPMWNSLIESRTKKLPAIVGSKHPCWCCHWLREVKRRHDEGAVICCVVSNIYFPDWIKDFGAGSSELGDLAADHFGLKREGFRNGRPPGWGEGDIIIPSCGTFSRVAPVHPDTQKPLGEGCRWERQALDGLGFPVYAFFMP